MDFLCIWFPSCPFSTRWTIELGMWSVPQSLLEKNKQKQKHIFKHIWAVLSDEQMRKIWPFSLLNDEQRVATRWGLSTNQIFLFLWNGEWWFWISRNINFQHVPLVDVKLLWWMGYSLPKKGRSSITNPVEVIRIWFHRAMAETKIFQTSKIWYKVGVFSPTSCKWSYNPLWFALIGNWGYSNYQWSYGLTMVGAHLLAGGGFQYLLFSQLLGVHDPLWPAYVFI